MSTSIRIVNFRTVSLDNAARVYTKLGAGGRQYSGQSRLIDLGGGGVFDPDAGIAAPKSPYRITQSYTIRGTEAQASTKVDEIELEWMESGTLTTGNAGTLTGRLVDIRVVPVKTVRTNDNLAVYDVDCTWEIIP